MFNKPEATSLSFPPPLHSLFFQLGKQDITLGETGELVTPVKKKKKRGTAKRGRGGREVGGVIPHLERERSSVTTTTTTV